MRCTAKTVPSDAAVVTPSRHDNQIAVFGHAFQKKIMDDKWFLIGCGALGCEYIKAFALMGVGSGKHGHVYTTDNDTVDLSNLSRQFLFREKSLNQPKSKEAAKAAKEMNPNMQLTAFVGKVCPETENEFTDDFWESLTGVWNALDNVHARRYSDSKCLLHSLPLIESGTQGTKANTEIILPFKTRSYSDTKDPETKEIAACTLRNFPNLIVHCIEWAKPKFVEMFDKLPGKYNHLVKGDKAKFFDIAEKEGGDKSKVAFFEDCKALAEAPHTFEGCMQLALSKFHQFHRDVIMTLQTQFPADARVIRKDEAGNSADMGPFWQGAKRFPQAAEFDPKNNAHLEWLFAGANLFAFARQIPQEPDFEKFKAALAKADLKAQPFKMKPWEEVDLEEKKGEESKENADTSAAAAQRAAELEEWFSKLDTSKLKELKADEFEKDKDENFHIDFLTAVSNLRAWNYHIEATDRLNVKSTAGHIIPALATTTAMITGLACLEYYKLSMGRLYLEEEIFNNANINLAVAQLQIFGLNKAIRFSAPAVSADKLSINMPFPPGFSTWDHIEIDLGRDITVQELLDLIPKIHFGVTPQLLFKADVSEKDIEEKRAAPLAQVMPDIVPTAALNQLKRPDLSANTRAIFEKQGTVLFCACVLCGRSSASPCGFFVSRLPFLTLRFPPSHPPTPPRQLRTPRRSTTRSTPSLTAR